MAGMEKGIFQADEYQPTAIKRRSRLAALGQAILRQGVRDYLVIQYNLLHLFLDMH
jgi:hypothetical protein